MDMDLGDGSIETMEDEEYMPEGMDLCSPSVSMALVNTRGTKMLMKERYVEPEYPRLPNEGNLEWQYTMRRTMQEIIPGLFLGPYASATRAKLDEMKAAGLTHIVCVRQYLEKNLIRPNHPDHFKYLVVEIAENIIPHFKTVNAFLDECITGGGKALVHGNAGISRSAALVIAFMMSKHGVTLKDAFSFVQSKRFCCNPNEGFMAQLREYEPIYRAQHTVPVPLPGHNPNRCSLKRGLEPDDSDPYVIGSIMTNTPQRLGYPNSNSNGPRTRQCISSAESSVSSSSESLPHVFPHIPMMPMPLLPNNQPTDSSMST